MRTRCKGREMHLFYSSCINPSKGAQRLKNCHELVYQRWNLFPEKVEQKNWSLSHKTFTREKERWTHRKHFQNGHRHFDGMIALGSCNQLGKSGLDQSEVHML